MEENLTNPDHPQWKRRRVWNMAGAVTGLGAFIAASVDVLVDGGSAESGTLLYAAGGLFLVSSGIYAATALVRSKR